MTGYNRNGRGHGDAPNPRNVRSEYSLYLFHETQKAWQVGMERGDRENQRCFWLPKSQCSVVTEFAKHGQGQTIILMVPLWLAEEKGLVKAGGEPPSEGDLVEDFGGEPDGYYPPTWGDDIDDPTNEFDGDYWEGREGPK